VTETPSEPALGLCASGAAFSIALRTEDASVHELVVDGRRQIGDLMSLLDRLLSPHGLAPADVGEIRVDRGPGSYTGLRTSVTFARVVAAFGGARLRAATSLELLALAAWATGRVASARPIRPILDARRGRAYTGRVERSGTGARLAGPPLAVPVGEVAGLVLPDETVLIAPAQRGWLPDDVAVHEPPLVTAKLLFDPALDSRPVEADALEPLYLMGSYAE